MDEYINREAIYKEACKGCTRHGVEVGSCFSEEPCEALIRAFVNAPAADVAPVRHGRWLNFHGDYSTAECDHCGELYEVCPEESPTEDFFNAFKEFYNYCPNCGARMDLEPEPKEGTT